MVRVLRPDFRITEFEEGFCLQSQKQPDVEWVLPHFAAFVLSLYTGELENDSVYKTVEYIFSEKIHNFEIWFLNLQKDFNQFLIPVDKARRLFDCEYPVYDSKALLVADKTTHMKPRHNPAPKFLSIYLTNYCNRQCRYCYAYPKKGNITNEKTIPIEDFKRLVFEAFELGVEKILLTGGEPLYSPHAYDLIQYITSLHIPVQVSTKMKIQFDKFEHLDLDLLDLSFSIDSHIKDTANYLTGSQSCYDDILYNIAEVNKRKIPLKASMVISKANQYHFADTIDFLIDNGAKRVFTGHYISEKHEEQDKSLLLSNDERNEIDKQIQKMQELSRYQNVLVNKPNEVSIVGDIKTIHCSTGITRINVKYDGKYAFCEKLMHHDSMLFSSIYENSLLQIWNSTVLHNLVYPNRSLYHKTICSECSDFDNCTGKNSCYWVSYGMYGTFYRANEEVEDVCIKNKNKLGV